MGPEVRDREEAAGGEDGVRARAEEVNGKEARGEPASEPAKLNDTPLLRRTWVRASRSPTHSETRKEKEEARGKQGTQKVLTNGRLKGENM